jgi:hypothetical protein
MAIIYFSSLIFIYWLVYVKYINMTITHDLDNKKYDKQELKEFINEHFNGICSYDSVANIVYICDNNIMTSPKFIEMLGKWKFYIQPALF